MKKEKVPEIFFLPKLKSPDELRAVLCYNNYLLQEIDGMKLHPLHKEDVKSVLLQAITQLQTITHLKESYRSENMHLQAQNWVLKFFQKIAGR